MTYWRLETPVYVARVDVRDDGVIVGGAPIIWRFTRGKSLVWLKNEANRYGWDLQQL